MKNPPTTTDLSRIALFSACTKQELALIARHTTRLEVPAGTDVSTEGRTGHEFFVIVEGQARVMVGDQEVALLGPGDFFGEVALLDGGPRTATVVAVTDLVVEVSGHQEFNDLLAGAPNLAKKLLVGLARRLRAADMLLQP